MDHTEVPRERTRFVELGKAIEKLWGERGNHRAPTDPARDRAVLHTNNQLPFEEIVAALDAIYDTQRVVTLGRQSGSVPAFDVSFVTD